MMENRKIHKKLKTKNFVVFLTEENNEFCVEYTDKRKILVDSYILQVEKYSSMKKAEFNFQLIADSIIVNDSQYIKEYILYIQNAKYSNKNSNRL